MSSEVKKFCNDIGTTLRALEEGTPWSNKAELYIGLIKEAVRKDICESNSPLCLWDYCVEKRARINNLTAKNAFWLHGSTPHTVTTGDEGDISNLCQYGSYEWCYFRDHTAAFPNNKKVLGRVLGPARGAGNEMAQWILNANGRVVPRRSLRPMMTQMRYFLTTSWLQLLKLEKSEELTLNILPRFGESVMKMPKEPLMSLPKHPLEQMIQLSQETTPPMTGC